MNNLSKKKERKKKEKKKNHRNVVPHEICRISFRMSFFFRPRSDGRPMTLAHRFEWSTKQLIHKSRDQKLGRRGNGMIYKRAVFRVRSETAKKSRRGVMINRIYLFTCEQTEVNITRPPQ